LLIATVLLTLAGCGQGDPATPPSAALPSAATSAVQPAMATSAPATAAPETMARYDGYGDVRFGMDEVAFGKAWSGELKATTPAQGSSCLYKRPAWVKAPSDFSFMFEGSHFVRYDIGTAKEAAPGGGKVGMDEAQIRALYGARVEAQPHKYVDGAKYLRIAAPQGAGMLVFETDAQGKIARWHVGVPPQVDYVEGCG
jgi:hypothetical protein